MKLSGLIVMALTGVTAIAGQALMSGDAPIPGTVRIARTGGVATLPAVMANGAAGSASIAASGVSLPELIYYGTCWWQFQTEADTDPPVALGNGYRNPHIEYDDYGDYFAGTVEKADAGGQITDVILAFAAAKTSEGLNPLIDVTDNAGLTYGLTSPQGERAVEIFDTLMTNPAYAQARIHVTGLSLGSAFTQFVLGHSIVTYGKAATAARAEFVHFGVPGYAQGIATHYGLTVADFDGLITGYTPKNDATSNNTPPGGIQHGQLNLNAQLMGVMHWMADYQPYGTSPTVALANSLAAHESYAYIGAFGWPAWMGAADRQQALDLLAQNAPATAVYDPSYGAGGYVAETIIGDGAANALSGTPGDDGLQGRASADLLTGGTGADSFIYSKVSDSLPTSPDLITDFAAGDRIDLTGMGRLLGFTFVGAQTPWLAGTVGYHFANGETLVEINTSGHPYPDMVIRLSGLRTLSEADFRLGGTLSDAAAYLLYQAFNTTGDPFIDHAFFGIPLT